MRLHDGLDSRQLLQMLKRDLAVEEKWEPVFTSSEGDSGLTVEERNSTARWLMAVNSAFGFYPETYVLAVSLLDTFVRTVKVQAKYVRCIGASCIFIAAKFHQEDEAVPTAQELVSGSDCSFSASDLRRMELLVLDKLGWSPSRVTALTFLHIFHALLLRSTPRMASAARQQTPRDPCGAGRLVQAMFNVTASSLACRWSPCSLALALLSLQASAWDKQAWLTPMLGLVALAKKDARELAACREEIARQPWLHFASRRPVRTLKPNNLDTLDAEEPIRTPKRKAMDEDLDDDVYECIKRLYSGEEARCAAAAGHSPEPGAASKLIKT